MKTFVQLTLAVSLAATASAAASHRHGHRHLHKKEATKVDKRDAVVTEVVAGAVQTVYKLGDSLLDAAEAQKGLDNGEYIVIGESTPTPPPPPPAPTTTKDLGGQFIESKSTTTTTTTTTPPPPPPPETTTSTPPPPETTTTSAAPAANAAASSDDDDSSSSVGGEDTPFPNGKLKCSEFPSKYGAVPLKWLDFGGWSGLQMVPDYTLNALSISNIITGIAGDNCKPNTMCSYACKPGYQKSQWSSAQGNTGQSVGGLYCNPDGYLELTRPSVKTLCTAGEGGVEIQNDLNELVSTCRTEYPGTEAMVIPTVAKAGQTVPLTNPLQSGYYQWQQKMTSAQYYVNPKGVTPEEGCLWTSPQDSDKRGNWAAVIVGVGMVDDGTTFISIFENKPTSSAKPDFNIEIVGGNSDCAYRNGVWYGGSSDGCTVSFFFSFSSLFAHANLRFYQTGLAKGKKATIRYY